MRSLVYEAELYVDGKRIVSKEMNISVRFELYILSEFYKMIDAPNVQEFPNILEKKCKTTNE